MLAFCAVFVFFIASSSVLGIIEDRAGQQLHRHNSSGLLTRRHRSGALPGRELSTIRAGASEGRARREKGGVWFMAKAFFASLFDPGYEDRMAGAVKAEDRRRERRSGEKEGSTGSGGTLRIKRKLKD